MNPEAASNRDESIARNSQGVQTEVTGNDVVSGASPRNMMDRETQTDLIMYFLSEQNTVDRVVDEYAPSINGNSIYMENPPVVVPGVIQEALNLDNDAPSVNGNVIYREEPVVLPGVIQEAVNLDNDAPSVNGNVIYREEHVVLPGAIQDEDDDVQFLCVVVGNGAVRRSEASSEHENEEDDSDHGDSFTLMQHDNETLQDIQEHVDQGDELLNESVAGQLVCSSQVDKSSECGRDGRMEQQLDEDEKDDNDDSSSVSSYLNEDMDGIDEVVQGLEKQKADEESSSRTRDVQLDKCFKQGNKSNGKNPNCASRRIVNPSRQGTKPKKDSKKEPKQNNTHRPIVSKKRAISKVIVHSDDSDYYADPENISDWMYRSLPRLNLNEPGASTSRDAMKKERLDAAKAKRQSKQDATYGKRGNQLKPQKKKPIENKNQRSTPMKPKPPKWVDFKCTFCRKDLKGPSKFSDHRCAGVRRKDIIYELELSEYVAHKERTREAKANKKDDRGDRDKNKDDHDSASDDDSGR